MSLLKKNNVISIQRLFYLKKEKVQFFQFSLTKRDFFKGLKTKVEQKKPPLTFHFKLDIFQKIAIRCIESGKNFLVAAHTSSGKTLVAEYAIAKSIKNKKRVIYTTPIKALSNQKFKDLSKIFSDVGLITGDVSINPNGSCIVMTTEVLRCILGSKVEKMEDLDWVIIDEAHYIKDFQRGFIWEEIFILLPKSVKFICLSATIPNILEFSEWLTVLRELSFASIVAKKRPVPLKEYVFFTRFSGLKLFKVSKNIFKSVNQKYFQKIRSSSNLSTDLMNSKIRKLVEKLYEIKYGPVILFTFSKKKCRDFAKILSPFRYCDLKSQKVIEKFLRKIKHNLIGKKSSYLSCEKYFEFFRNGIGIHHAGLSHFLREITETLFHANLLFILFATETFSIGLNMPSKTVIFSSLIKYDGKHLRFLNRGEFIQMSGRAGRRGLDKKGIVISILNLNDKDPKTMKVLSGNSEPIGSVFRLTINTFLDFIDRKKYRLKKIISKSFFNFQKKINKMRFYSSYYILKKRTDLIISPKFKVVLEISFFLKLVEKAFQFESNYFKKEKSVSMVQKHLFSKNGMRNINNSLVLKKNKCPIAIKIKRNPEKLSNLKFFFPFKKLKSSNILFKEANLIYYKKFETFIKLISVYMKMKKILSRYLVCSLNSFFYHFIFKYRFEFLKFKKEFKFKISQKDNGSVHLEISKFFVSFLKIGLIKKNFNLTKKGEICSMINYKENLILIELAYHGTLVNFPFEVIITLLVSLVCDEQYSETSLHPCLFSSYNDFQLIVLKLYSVFKGSILSIHLWQIFKKKKKTTFNFIWAWINNLCPHKKFKFLLSKEVFIKNLNYVLNILEIMAKIYQSLGNIFFSSKMENFWFRLKQKLKEF